MSRTRHAFQACDWFTCSTCDNCKIREGRPYCMYSEDFNRWNIFRFGCGNYATTASGGVEINVTLDCFCNIGEV